MGAADAALGPAVHAHRRSDARERQSRGEPPGVDPAVCIIVANGFDAALFAPRIIDRAGFWRRALVQNPQGWRPGGEPGSVAYEPEQVTVLAQGVVLVAVGRYTAVKRLGLLIDAFARAERRARRVPGLVIVGGYPGECEGEHPWDAVQRTGARNVFLAGWQEHSALPTFLNAADAQVLASVREQFGVVLVEGMASGLPAIGVDRLGPAEIIDDGRTGWLVKPDDVNQLADAIVAALDDDSERRRRGIAALRPPARAGAGRRSRGEWPALSTRPTGPCRASRARNGSFQQPRVRSPLTDAKRGSQHPAQHRTSVTHSAHQLGRQLSITTAPPPATSPPRWRVSRSVLCCANGPLGSSTRCSDRSPANA